MQKEFVTYEIAVILKVIGFNEPCIAYYVNDTFKFKIYLNKDANYNYDFTVGNLVAAPLWQQVIDWLREKHDVHLSIEPLHRPKKYNKLMYCYCTSYKDNFYGGMDDNLDAWLELSNDGINYHVCETYEEARTQAILEAIKLCQRK
jgi:hypothetical protein